MDNAAFGDDEESRLCEVEHILHHWRYVLSLFCGGAVSDWDGHEPSRLSLDYDEGYHVWRLDVVRNVIANPCNMSIADNDITIPSVEIIFRVIPSVCFGGRLQLANFGGRAAPMAA
jgi:hypothetical protein